MKTVLALRHVAFEDLGLLEPMLARAGYAIRYVEMGVDSFATLAPLEPDLVVVLGGPVSVYDVDAYPWLAPEIDWIRTRVLADRPTLGICLGAQLMAAALGARVHPGPAKEIGWGGLRRAEDSDSVPGFDDYLDRIEAVMHWHGDTFDLPAGACRLASTALYQNHAFGWGAHCLGLQFHPEFDPAKLEHWLIGHAVEIAHAPGVSPAVLRADTLTHGALARAAAERFFAQWLGSIAAADGQANALAAGMHPGRCMRNF